MLSKTYPLESNQISDFHQYKQNLKLSLSNKKEVFGIYNPMKFSLLAKNPNILCKNEDLFFIFFNLYSWFCNFILFQFIGNDV